MNGSDDYQKKGNVPPGKFPREPVPIAPPQPEA